MWSLVFALPNLKLKESVGNDQIAIAPYHDNRIIEIKLHSEVAEIFVENFENQSRRKVEPSFLILNANTPKDDYGIVCYRNALALSTIIKGHEHHFAYGNRAYPFYSDNFDFYPITVSENYRLLESRTPDELGINFGYGNFRGQRSPGLATVAEPYSISDHLFNHLQKIWEETFLGSSGLEDWSTRALFRSLEMAYRATAMPMKNRETISDYGTSASLWVSAFEILAHPGDENVGIENILNLIEEYQWADDEISNKTYVVGKLKNDTGPRMGNLPLKLYCDLYETRNDFLHGNPVEEENLFPFGNDQAHYLIRFAPLIYKLALMVHLEKFKDKWKLSEVSVDDESKKMHDKRLADALRKSEGAKK